MTSPAVELRPRSLGEILKLTFGLYRKHFPLFIGIAAAVLLPILLVNALSQLLPLVRLALMPEAFIGGSGADAFAPQAVAFSTASLCLSLTSLGLGVAWPWMEGALAFNVIERVLGRELGLRPSYTQTRMHWGALWGSNLLAQLGINAPIMIAYLMLLMAVFLSVGTITPDLAEVTPFAMICLAVVCVPIFVGGLVLSLWLAISWAFRAPAIVGEGVDGLRGLQRSMAIARGDRWRILGRFLGLFVVEFFVLAVPVLILPPLVFIAAFGGRPEILSGELNLDTSALPGIAALSVVGVAINFVGSLLLTPFRIIFTTVNYLDLRIRKENLAEALSVAAATSAAKVADPGSAAAPPIAEPAAAPAAPPQPAPPQPAAAAPAHAPSLDFKNVDLSKLTPGQRVGVLFNRIRAEGENPQWLNELGLAFMEIGDWGGAMDVLTRARTIAPNDPDIVYNLMLLYRQRNNFTAARAMMQEYLRLETDPQALDAVRNNPRLKELLPES